MKKQKREKTSKENKKKENIKTIGQIFALAITAFFPGKPWL